LRVFLFFPCTWSTLPLILFDCVLSLMSGTYGATPLTFFLSPFRRTAAGFFPFERGLLFTFLGRSLLQMLPPHPRAVVLRPPQSLLGNRDHRDTSPGTGYWRTFFFSLPPPTDCDFPYDFSFFRTFTIPGLLRFCHLLLFRGTLNLGPPFLRAARHFFPVYSQA